jgi:oxygen-dependent protoporphyrinogen oxidase
LLSGGAKLRALGELLRGPREGSRSETLFAFVARRFGRDVADRFLVPFTSGIYGAHPSRLGAADAFPGLPAMERGRGSVLRGLMSRAGGTRREVLLADGGMQSIPDALGRALGSRVRLEAPVAALEPLPERESLLRVVLASGEALDAREVVLATTAPTQARLLAPLAPHVAETLLAVRSTPLAVVSVGLPPGDPPLPESFGFLAGHASGARILGATFPSRLSDQVAPPGHGLASVFVGGSERPDALALSDAALAELALSDLSRALGGALHPDLVDVVRYPAAIPLFTPGHRGRMAAAQARLARFGITLSGSHVTGVGLDACCRERGPLVSGVER